MHHKVATGGEMKLWSPSPSASNITPVQWRISDLLGSAYTGVDSGRDVDILKIVDNISMF